jgi:hypothetical protein
MAIKPAHAEPTTYWLNLGGISAHDSPGLNGVNPGLGIEARTSDVWAFGAGMYRNSDRRTSRYLTTDCTPWRFDMPIGPVYPGIKAGAVDGYPFHDGAVIPAAALIADLRLERVAFQLAYVPKLERFKTVNTLALTFKVRF